MAVSHKYTVHAVTDWYDSQNMEYTEEKWFLDFTEKSLASLESLFPTWCDLTRIMGRQFLHDCVHQLPDSQWLTPFCLPNKLEEYNESLLAVFYFYVLLSAWICLIANSLSL